MFKTINKLLRGNKGFTLAEVAISTAALASLLSIFALLPGLKMGYSNVNMKQKANYLIEEITSQIEDANSESAIIIIIAKGNSDGTDFEKYVPRPTDGPISFDVMNRQENTKVNVTLQSFYLSASDVNLDGKLGDEVSAADGSNLGRLKISVNWARNKTGPVYKYQALNNSYMFGTP